MSARIPLFVTVFLPVLASAQSQSPSQDVGGSLFQLLFGLALVVALLFASLWLLKRLAAPRGEAAGLLRVVAATAVGARERVVIVEVGPTWLVLGVAPGSVTALAEVQRSSLPPAAEAPPAKDFAGRLSQILNRRHAP